MLASFWWGQKQDERKIHWASWLNLTSSKENREMGFKDLNLLNIALLAKQGWRMLINPKAWWERVLWQIMSGEDVDIWKDMWIKDTGLACLENVELDFPKKASDLINRKMNAWQLETIEDYIFGDQLRDILAIPICKNSGKDRMVWPKSKDRAYTVKVGYHSLKNMEGTDRQNKPSRSYVVEDKVWKVIWKIPVLPKNEEETIVHALLLCDWTVVIWHGLDIGYKVDRHIVTSLDRWFEGVIGLAEAIENGIQRCDVGISVVIRYERGNVISRLANKVNVSSSIEAKVAAIREGMYLAATMKIQRIVVEIDSEVLYKGLAG
ncbi:hypothetical protein CRYUN_Cryun34aG0112800 [Craigia yunnanensis]